ncbi:hypothetical protein OZ676_003461, partial [Yersinia enterocolitica]
MRHQNINPVFARRILSISMPASIAHEAPPALYRRIIVKSTGFDYPQLGFLGISLSLRFLTVICGTEATGSQPLYTVQTARCMNKTFHIGKLINNNAYFQSAIFTKQNIVIFL